MPWVQESAIIVGEGKKKGGCCQLYVHALRKATNLGKQGLIMLLPR